MANLSLSAVAVGVYTALNVAGLTSLCGSRIYDSRIPRNPSYPFVSVQLSDENNGPLGTRELVRVDVRVRVHSTSETDAETQTAIDKVSELQGAVDGLAEGVTIPVTLAGDEDTKRRLKLLRTELQLTIDKANEADRAVARVAG